MANATRKAGLRGFCTKGKLIVVLITGLVLILGSTISIVLIKVLPKQKTTEFSQVDLIRTVQCGHMQGTVEISEKKNKALVYKGIPYAKPPTGRRRWKPPEEIHDIEGGGCWEGVYNATEFGKDCAQQLGNKIIGSEDCLYLNVWTVNKRHAPLRPVIVWIHGGGLSVFNGGVQGYAPNADVVNALDVVAVSMNYRLNAFGFMTLDVLSENSTTNSSGNYGLMDQILALKWVKNNIKAFGGDPNLVTILGQSAGGKAVYALVASPMASGLFHRAVIMSGQPVYIKSFKEAAVDNQVFIDRANCSSSQPSKTLECLYGLSPLEVLLAVPWNVKPYWGQPNKHELPTKDRFSAALAVIDPIVVPVSTLKLANSSALNINSVPVLITTTAQETETPAARKLSRQPLNALKQKLWKHLGTFSANLPSDALANYTSSNQTEPSDYGLTYIDMTSDIRVTCPTNTVVSKMAQGHQRSVYQMIVSSKPSKKVKFFGVEYIHAFHGWDIFAFFDFTLKGAGDFGPHKLYEPSEFDVKFKDDLYREIGHFIRFGKPQKQNWTPYPTVAVYRKNEIRVQRHDYHERHCRFWNERSFFPYGWML